MSFLFQSNIHAYFKSSNLLVSIIRYKSKVSAHQQILVDHFGLSQAKARVLVNKLKLYKQNTDHILDTIKFCKDRGFSNELILDVPEILVAHPLRLEQHYLCMEEGGFQNITPRVLSKARKWMHRPVLFLKNLHLIPQDTSVADSFLQYIKDIPPNFELYPMNDSMMWSLIHFKILQEFLRCKLEASEDEIIRLFRIHKMITNKSMRVVQENIAIAEDLGYSKRKLLKCGYLLHNYPQYTKTILSDFPNLAGADMRVAMRQYPKLIMTAPRSILKIYGILKEFNIPDETIRNQMNVFHLSPETVRLRLEEIKRTPDFRVLLEHPRVLKLVIYHNRSKSRLSFLEQLQLKCASLVLIGSNNDVFDSHVREGKDANSLGDVLLFLKSIFKIAENNIRKKWKKHPFHLQVPILEIEKTYLYLTEMNMTRQDIFHVMHILLYPMEKVQKTLNEILENKIAYPRGLTNVQKLNLVLYLIEKEHHFTGNGIWRSDHAPLETTLSTLE